MRFKLTILILLISTPIFGQENKLYKFIGKDKKYGFMDKTGSVKIKPIYLAVEDFADGFCFVSKEIVANDYRWICIDTSGNEWFDKGNRIDNGFYSRIKFYQNQASETLQTTDTLVRFRQDNLWGFKNQRGEIVIEPKYHLANRFQNGICAVRLNYQPVEIGDDYYLDAMINTKGQVISQQPMHCFMGFRGDLIVYYGGPHFSGGIHYLDKEGQKVIPKE